MKKGRQIKSELASIENVRRFFSTTPNDDAVSIEEAFRAWGRPNPENMEDNKQWLSNVLYHLKYHDLITPIYTFSSGRKKLDKIRLNLKGKLALGRLEGEGNYAANGEVFNNKIERAELDINDFMEAYPRLKEKYKAFDIDFTVMPKKKRSADTP